MALLDVRNLVVEITIGGRAVNLVDDVSFGIDHGACLGLVGESGAGKTMTALAIMGLLPDGVARIKSGRIDFAGQDLTQADENTLRGIRGNDIAMIFQEPMTALNPVLAVGEQIAEVIRTHQNPGRKAAWNMAAELLDAVGIADAAHRAHDAPHAFSGGQRQRVLIAQALACNPRLLIADEPSSALDVTTAAQIFDLLCDLRKENNMAMLLISHDMGAVAAMAQRALVMYAGRKVEAAAVADLLAHPRHPYTKALIAANPHMRRGKISRAPLNEIPGVPPVLESFGVDTCLFAPRCAYADDLCRASRPDEKTYSRQHVSACRHAKKL